MKPHRKILAIAVAAAFPWVGAQAQSNADLLREINQLKAQLKMLQDKVEAQASQPPAAPAIDPVEFNRLALKVEQAEEDRSNSGLKGIKFKGVIEAQYFADRYSTNGTTMGFVAGNGSSNYSSTTTGGTGMFEISKETEGSEGVSWTLRMTPGGGGSVRGGNLLHEASISVPVERNVRLIAGLIPDWQGYEYTFGHQNPLVSHNLMFDYAGPTSYSGAGLSYTDGPLAFKWAVANIDEQHSRKSPGFVYRMDYTVNEFAFYGIAGAHSRTTRKYDLLEIDGGYVRGDWTFNGQINYGKESATFDGTGAQSGGASNGGDSRWWGVSVLAGYKFTPRLQGLARFDMLNNRKNGGGMYAAPVLAATNDTANGFGPELDSTGFAADPDRGVNRYALTLGTNYAVNASTQWKTEVRIDRSSGYNFLTSNGEYKKSNTKFGTALVVSF